MEDIVLISISEKRLKELISEALIQAVEKVNKDNDPLKDYPDLLTRTQVSKILGIALNTVDAWSREENPRLNKVFIGNAAKFRKADIQRILKVG